MTNPDVLVAVRDCVAEVCGVPSSEVAEDGKLLGYGIDSVRALELIFALEDHLGVALNETDPRFAAIQTVRELADFVAGHLDAR